MKSSKNILKGIGSVVLSSLIIIGCGDENLDNPETIKPGDSTAVAVEVKDVPIQKLDNAIFSIPSPIQLGQIIQKSGAAYNEDELATTLSYFPNSTDWVNDYDERDDKGKKEARDTIYAKMKKAREWILNNARGLVSYRYLEGLLY